MTSSSEINQRNPRHNQPPPPERAGTISHATGTKNLALTNKHTVEFSNNRHTPTQHHPTGQNLAWGNFSNLPDPRCPLQLGDPSGKGRGTGSLHDPARRAKLRAVPRRGTARGTSHRLVRSRPVSVPPCRANVENTTRGPRPCQLGSVPRPRGPQGRGPTRARNADARPRRRAKGPGRSTRSDPSSGDDRPSR